jgi:hypothetical protein
MGWQTDGANVDLAVAIQNAGANYNVEKHELLAVVRGGDGQVIRATPTGDYGIMREPLPEDNEWRYFGAVTEDYKVLQNARLGELLQPINDVYPVETVGVIDEGATAFMTFDAGEYTVNGEKNRHYIFGSTGHNGMRGVNFGLTKVCMVCKNTYMYGISTAALHFKISHKGDVEGEVENAVALLAGLERTIDTDIKRDTQLGAIPIAYDEAVEIIRKSYADPRPPRKVQMAGTAAQSQSMTRDQVVKLLASQGGVGKLAETYQRQQERTELMRTTTVQVYDAYEKARPGIYGTPLGVFNAVTEVANWREGPNADHSIMFGGIRAKTMDAAYKQVTAMAGVA